ncbi:MAG: DNA-directed RNA polymerase subunit omega [bacterium]
MTESPQQGSKTQLKSKFQLVIAAAKRSKQIAGEAKARGLSPNQVALVKSKSTKSTTLALEELKAGKVRYTWSKGLPVETMEPDEQPQDQEEMDPDGHRHMEPLPSESSEIPESKC